MRDGIERNRRGLVAAHFAGEGPRPFSGENFVLLFDFLCPSRVLWGGGLFSFSDSFLPKNLAYHGLILLLYPWDQSRLVHLVNLPSSGADELKPEPGMVERVMVAMAERWRRWCASREHSANPRSVGSGGGVCGSD